MSKRLKILCLHGYRQNDVLFREKTGSLRKLFKKYADFEFVSAPLIPNVEENDREGARGWWFSKTDNQFSSKDVTEIATGFEESVEVVLRFISTNGPFDGIFGFSQGASMAHLLLAKEQLGEICYPKWKMGNKVSQDHSPGDGSFGQQFRVYIHRRNKIIHAWLRITADDIFLEKSKSDVVSWPLQLIRRYGYTSAGVFFFESGRRCRTGEGLHCFQTQNADIIFQLVQQRVQDNANVQKAKSMRRNERAQSSGPVLHSSINHPASRVNHIQRFGSEGGGVGSEYLSEPAGYNSYHQGSQATNRLRKVVLPPPPRPRSVGGEDDEPHHLPPSSFHPQRSHNQYSDQRIVGSILSESRNPSAFEDEAFSSSRRSSSGSQASCSSVSTSQFRPPYVNISTQEVLASPRIRSGSTSSRSSHSGVSSPTTPVRTAIPLKWNVGAGSTNLICYAQPALATTRSPNFSPETIGSDVDGVFRYVNVTEIGGRPLLEKSSLPSPRLNYADVGPGEQERGPSRCSSIGQRSEVDLGNVNYTLIDADKTRALQAAAAASVDDRISNAVRRRNLTGGN